MKSRLLIVALLLPLTPKALAQTADDFVAQGRAYLTAMNIVAANQSFSNAVVRAADHPVANVFYAATRLLVLPTQPAGSNFLNRIGVPTAGRDIYQWLATPPTDANGTPLAPAGVSATEFTALLRTNVLPALIAAEANLAKVTDTNFTLALTSSETRAAGVTLDYGDIVLLRALLQSAEYFAYTIHSWNLDVQLTAIRAFYDAQEVPTADRILREYPSLLTFATTNDLRAAKLTVQTGANLYLEASQFIRSRSTNVTRLFNYDVSQAGDEESFRQTLTDLTNSLVTATPLTDNTNYAVFLGAQFNGTRSPRSFLPQFRDNGFGLGTLPDITFGGLIQGLTEDQVENALSEILPPIPTFAHDGEIVGGQFHTTVRVAPDRGYTVQVSTNLTTWSDYDEFFAVSNSYSFVDGDAYTSTKRFYRVEERYRTLTLGDELNNLSGAADSQINYLVTVPPGASYLSIYTWGGSGDCDLYVNFGAPPTLDSWNYRPYLHGNDEFVFISNPPAGNWYIMLQGYKSYSGVTLGAYAY
jgi:hypothetical protein